jgi:formylmethanofuran dehydrogenase subunit E
MPYSDNPVADYDRYCAEQERQMEKLPKCDRCGQPVTDYYYYEIDGENLCEKCLKDNYRKCVDDYD